MAVELKGRDAAMLNAQPIFTVDAELDEIRRFGTTPYGERRVVGIRGGTVSGAKLSGRILPGGTDMQVMAADGSLDIHARYTLETDAGALVQVDSQGMRHAAPEVLARLGRGEEVDPTLYYFRTAMRFETAHPETAWLNRILAIARGIREKNAVWLDVYEVL